MRNIIYEKPFCWKWYCCLKTLQHVRLFPAQIGFVRITYKKSLFCSPQIYLNSVWWTDGKFRSMSAFALSGKEEAECECDREGLVIWCFSASYPKLFGPENLVIYYFLTNRNVKIIAIYSPVKCCINCVTNIKSTLHSNA